MQAHLTCEGGRRYLYVFRIFAGGDARAEIRGWPGADLRCGFLLIRVHDRDPGNTPEMSTFRDDRLDAGLDHRRGKESVPEANAMSTSVYFSPIVSEYHSPPHLKLSSTIC